VLAGETDEGDGMSERTMTPSMLGILLHYYIRTDDHPDRAANDVAFNISVRRLTDYGLLEERGDHGQYVTTERAMAHLAKLEGLGVGNQPLALPAASWTESQGAA
jgi:hypothetical protein